MTAEEAIEVLGLVRVCDGERITDALNMAIEALQKQIPMKPHTTGEVMASCPHCRNVFPYTSVYGALHKIKFCWDCGQAIDWTEDDE